MEQLTKKQLRALDLMVKGLTRKYPFIIGWKPSEDFLNYDTMINLNFIVDYKKLADFFDAKPNPYWLNVIKEEGFYQTYSLGGPFNYDEYPHIKDLSYETSDNIERLLTTINKELPEDMTITYPYENFRGETINVPRQIRRDYYTLQ
jgi:hypothetical protein